MHDLLSGQSFSNSDATSQSSYAIIMGAWFLGMLYFTIRSYKRRMAKRLAANQFYTTADETSVERKRATREMTLRLRIARYYVELFCSGLFTLLTAAMNWAVLTDPETNFATALTVYWYMPPLPILGLCAFCLFWRDLKRKRAELKVMAQE